MLKDVLIKPQALDWVMLELPQQGETRTRHTDKYLIRMEKKIKG